MKFSKQFKSLKLKTSCFFLVHWWLKGLISIWNGFGKWCSICWDTKPFTVVNASWIYITNIFYKRRLHSLLSAWVVLKMDTLKEANNLLLWNLHAFLVVIQNLLLTFFSRKLLLRSRWLTKWHIRALGRIVFNRMPGALK